MCIRDRYLTLWADVAWVCLVLYVCLLVSMVVVNTRLTVLLCVWSVIRWVVALITEPTANVSSSLLTTQSR